MKDAMLLEKAQQAHSTAIAPVDLPKIADYYKWAFERAELIRAGQFDKVDLLNVADEIESVGKAEYRAVAINLEIIIVHMLKWDYQPDRRSRSWDDSIFEHRHRVMTLLEDNPSFTTKCNDALDAAYNHARRVASRQTKLVLSRFPAICPYSWSDVMEASYELDERS